MEQHNHNHSVGESLAKSAIGTIYLCLLINICFVVVEALVGLWSNSTGLLSDAGHNLSDILGLVLSLIALRLEKRKGGERMTLYVTIANVALLLVAVALIVGESIDKIMHPTVVNAEAVVGVALVAIVINGLTAWILLRGKSDNINIRAAFLHAATDALVSVGVVISGVVIRVTGVNIIDPLVSLVISVVIAVPTIKLLIRTLRAIKNH